MGNITHMNDNETDPNKPFINVFDDEKFSHIADILSQSWHACNPPRDLPLHTVWTCSECNSTFVKEEEGPGLWREIEPYE